MSGGMCADVEVAYLAAAASCRSFRSAVVSLEKSRLVAPPPAISDLLGSMRRAQARTSLTTYITDVSDAPQPRRACRCSGEGSDSARGPSSSRTGGRRGERVRRSALLPSAVCRLSDAEAVET